MPPRQLLLNVALMNKKTLAAVVVVVALAGGAFLLSRGTAPSIVDTTALSREENELTSFDIDLTTFAGDEVAARELDQVVSDVSDDADGVSAAAALDDTSIGREQTRVDGFRQDLAESASDDTVLPELNPILGDISQ